MQMFSYAVFLGSIFLAGAQIDKTRQEKAKGSEVVQAVVDLIHGSCIFPDDKLLLRRIAYVESKDGLDPNTFAHKDGKPYYGGIWQVDEIAFKDTKDNKSHPGLTSKFEAIKETFNIDWATVQWKDLLKPLYSGLAARLKLSTVNAAIPRDLAGQAAYWKQHYNSQAGSGTVQKFIDEINALYAGCDLPRADLVFVLDSSGSVTSTNFNTMKDFVKNVVKSLDIGKDKIRVGVINYSTSSVTEFNLDKYSTANDTLAAIERLSYQNGGTNTHLALSDLMTVMKTSGRGNITGIPQIAIVITDGKSDDKGKTAALADKVHATGMTVFAIGVTNGINEEELKKIGSDPDCIHVFKLADFTEVTMFKEEIENRACKASAEVDEPASEIEGELKQGQKQYYTFNVDTKKGATFKINASDGSILFYTSYKNRNPNSAYHDYKMECDSNCEVFVPPEKQLRKGKIARRAATENTTQPLYTTMEGVGQNNTFTLQSVVGDERTPVQTTPDERTPVHTSSAFLHMHGSLIWQIIINVFLVFGLIQ